MNEQQVRALFLLAGLEVLRLHELANDYWPESYVELRKASPWWLVETPFGLIKIGWRKRVISIDWTSTPLRKIITPDDVTKSDETVHAWSYAKALEYLTSLRIYLKQQEKAPEGITS